ncbi:MAG TPA: hypothetical protein VGN63_03010 [Flavisolibacter sp.]|jgi:hypothetical protein|nr:hypothetical protein [Flavisolibacter sp.]
MFLKPAVAKPIAFSETSETQPSILGQPVQQRANITPCLQQLQFLTIPILGYFLDFSASIFYIQSTQTKLTMFGKRLRCFSHALPIQGVSSLFKNDAFASERALRQIESRAAIGNTQY